MNKYTIRRSRMMKKDDLDEKIKEMNDLFDVIDVDIYHTIGLINNFNYDIISRNIDKIINFIEDYGIKDLKILKSYGTDKDAIRQLEHMKKIAKMLKQIMNFAYYGY